MDWSSESGFLNSRSFHQSNFQGSTDCPGTQTQDYLSQQRKYDEDFISNFIADKKKIKKSKFNSIKISDAKNLLLEIINEKKNLEKDVLSLDVTDEKFNCEWEVLLKKLNKIENNILEFNSEVKTPLKQLLNKRLKKRNVIKAKITRTKLLRKAQQEDFQKRHEIIDKILNERSEEVESIKHEAALKRQADIVLHKVRRKKYEAKKMLNLLIALRKLRELRSKEEEKLGGYCSKQLTETFNKVMTRFQNLWDKQLEVYKLEEKGLKIMLEENTVPQKKDSTSETNILQWEKVLFGDITKEKLPMVPDVDNIEALIQVRRDWDQFLTGESSLVASSIPLGWVLPSETDERWKEFTKSRKHTLLSY